MRKNVLKISLLIGALILIAVITSLLSPTPTSPSLNLPGLNGYDTFVTAAAMLPVMPTNWESMDHEALRAFVESTTNALQTARAGLELECQVPLEFSQPDLGRNMEEMRGMKSLTTAFAAEARLADMENRPKDAAKSCIDAIRLGTQVGRGGILIHELFGVAIEATGTRQLKLVSGRLDAATCRETVKTLESVDARRESWSDILQRERAWASRVGGIREQWARLFASGLTRATLAKAQSRYNSQVTAVRRTMIEFAGFAFEQENHRKATGFSDLVPEYLKAIPKDPETGADMPF